MTKRIELDMLIQQIWRIGSSQNHGANNATLGKNPRQMQFRGRRGRQITIGHEQQFAILRRAIGLRAEQNSRLKIVQQIAVGQHERDDVRLFVSTLI